MRPRGKVMTFRLKHEREKTPLRIISDAAMATRVLGEGRLIPVLIVDASERPDVRELLSLQEYLLEGDAESQWGQSLKNKADVMLMIRFLRPTELTMLIDFEIPRQAGLVDMILKARALYLQLGAEGDRLGNTAGEKKLRIEIVGTFPQWEDMMFQRVFQDFRGRGLSRPEAKRAAKEFVIEWRKFTGFRMPGS